MPCRTLIVSAQGGIGKTSLALGSACLSALSGTKAGYLGIGYSKSLGNGLNVDHLRTIASPSSALSLSIYSCPIAEVELAVADVEVSKDQPVSELQSHLSAACTGAWSHAESWFVDWKLPIEMLTEPISHEFSEVWHLRTLASGADLFYSENRRWTSAWIEVSILPDDDSLWGQGISEEHGATSQNSLILQRSVAAISDGCPQVLIEPFSRNAVSIAAFLRGRQAHER